MANPQKEEGHLQIANEIVEALVRTPLPGTEMRLVLHVLRKTYGFGKKRDWISISQFAAALGIDNKSVCRSTKRLVGWKILEKKGNEIGLNKNWESWGVVASAPLARKPRGSGVHASGKTRPRVVASAPHTKDRLQKTVNNTDPDVSLVPPDETDAGKERNKTIGEIIDVFKKTINPEIKFDHKGHRAASGRIVDGIGAEKAVAAAKYAVSVQSDRYAPTITNPTELERKLPALRVYMARETKPTNGGIAIIS